MCVACVFNTLNPNYFTINRIKCIYQTRNKTVAYTQYTVHTHTYTSEPIFIHCHRCRIVAIKWTTIFPLVYTCVCEMYCNYIISKQHVYAGWCKYLKHSKSIFWLHLQSHGWVSVCRCVSAYVWECVTDYFLYVNWSFFPKVFAQVNGKNTEKKLQHPTIAITAVTRFVDSWPTKECTCHNLLDN